MSSTSTLWELIDVCDLRILDTIGNVKPPLDVVRHPQCVQPNLVASNSVQQWFLFVALADEIACLLRMLRVAGVAGVAGRRTPMAAMIFRCYRGLVHIRDCAPRFSCRSRPFRLASMTVGSTGRIPVGAHNGHPCWKRAARTYRHTQRHAPSAW